jgi:hypothetical protein
MSLFGRCFKVLFLLQSTLIPSIVLPISTLAQESPPDWARKTFYAPPDRVFDAALKSIAAQPYEMAVKNEENKMVSFTVGKSAFSWGYVMVLRVSPGVGDTSKVSVEVTRLRGPHGEISIVASGKKEVQKVLRGMEKELSVAPDVPERRFDAFSLDLL